MIDFRYHIVSIVAVFLALTLGIVIGTYTINGQLLDNIKDQVKSLRHDNDGLRDRVRTLEGQVGDGRSFVTTVAPMLISGQLARQRVVMVIAPGASGGLAKNVAESIREAGGTVSTTVKVSKSWVDPTQTAILGDLASRLAEPGALLPDGTAYDKAGGVVAAALLDHPPQDLSNPGSLTSSQTSALAAFQEARLLSLSPERPDPATLAVLVTANAPGDPTSDDQKAAAALAAFARQLDLAGSGTVVVGTEAAAQPGGVLAAVRHDGDINRVVSSVDDADTATGEVRTVLALAAEVRGVSGQYGVGPGSQRPAPSPEPSASTNP